MEKIFLALLLYASHGFLDIRGQQDIYFKLRIEKSSVEMAAKVSWEYYYGDAVQYIVRYSHTKYLGCDKPNVLVTERIANLFVTVDRHPTNKRLKSLHPYSRYNVTVTAVTISGYQRNQSLVFQTDPTVPRGIPTNVKLSRLEATNARIQWLPPPCETHNGYFSGYHYILFDKDRNGVVKQGNIFNNYVDIANLVPYRQYMFRVSVLNQHFKGNYSKIISFRTLESIPPPPTNVIAEALNETSLKCSWSPPYPESGVLGKYNIRMWAKGGQPQRHSTLSQNSTTIITDLKPDTYYCIEVRASTSKGFGYWSKYACNRTRKAIPDAPESLLVTKITNTSMTLKWTTPAVTDEPIIGYRLFLKALRSYDSHYEISNGKIEILEHNLTHTFTKLHPGTLYRITVRSVDKKGMSTAVEKENWTRFAELETPPQPVLLQANSTFVHVNLSIIEQSYGTPVSHFTITLEELEEDSGGRSNITWNELKRNSYQNAQIIAELSPEWFGNTTRMFTVGDAQTYGRFLNKPLRPGIKYYLGFGVVSKNGDSVFTFLTIKTSGTKVYSILDDKWEILFYGVMSALGLVLVIVFIVLLIIRMKNQTKIAKIAKDDG
ncbi:phosphatidylinositol phosphatase PTPRQ-like [Tubulanus polymorphus]|uniref:phosphatidylinositol phosphatase PTPRQ-like n=1 Tax=Tubulanus polymorphus TaxID=672921 RepID=UPI003DA66CE4